MHARDAERKWKCWCCGTLLGVERGSEVELKYKEAVYRVRRPVKTQCRRCGAGCQLEGGSDGGAERVPKP